MKLLLLRPRQDGPRDRFPFGDGARHAAWFLFPQTLCENDTFGGIVSPKYFAQGKMFKIYI